VISLEEDVEDLFVEEYIVGKNALIDEIKDFEQEVKKSSR
jgi:hypothetical protein